jgi:zinc protease
MKKLGRDLRLFFYVVTSAWVGFLFLSTAQAGPIDIKRLVTPAGIEIWFVEEHSIPVIAFEAAFRGVGARSDPAGKAGLAYLASGLLDEGAGELDSAAFQEKLESLALRLSFSADKDDFHVNLYTLSENRSEAFDMLGAALQSPRFDAEPLERIRAQILVGIEHSLSDPETLASLLWWKSLLPDHPYGRPTTGSRESVEAISRDDLVRFTDTALARDNLVVAVVGDIGEKELVTLVDKALSGLPDKASLQPAAELAAEQFSQLGHTLILSLHLPQSVSVFGQAGLKREDPDFIPAFVMNYILGSGGFSSRLFDEIREQRGLAYSVYTSLYAMDRAGFLIGAVSSENTRLAQSLALTKKEFARLREEGVTEVELNDAKTYLTGSYPLRFDSNADIADQLISIQLDNLGIDYVNKRNDLVMAVSREDILRIARRLLTPESLLTVVVGSPTGIKSAGKVDLKDVEQ